MPTLYGGSVEVLTGSSAGGKPCDFCRGVVRAARYNVYDKDMPRYACKRHLTAAIEQDARVRPGR